MFRLIKSKIMLQVLSFAAAVIVAVGAANAAVEAPANFMVNAATGSSDYFYEVAVTPDGGYVAGGKAGADSDATVAKFNKYGYMEWAKSFVDVSTSSCNALAAGDAGIFLTGRTASATLWVAKLAPWGQILWQKEYTYGGHTSPNIMGVSVAATQDGGCAVSLRIRSGDYSYEQGLAKIAADGSLDWVKFYGTTAYDMSGEIIETRDTNGDVDGYLMVTAEDEWGGVDLGNEVILIKTDTAGAKQWVYAYAGYDTADPADPDGNEFVKGICQTADFGYAVTGNSYSASDPQWSDRRTPYLLKVDNTGAKLWAKKFGMLSSDPGANAFGYGDVAQVKNNTDLIVAGTYHTDRHWLLRFAEDGSLVRECLYPEFSVKDRLRSVVATEDGGGVVSGDSQSFGAGDYDAFLMKFNADLEFPDTDCPACTDPESEVDDMRFDQQDVTGNCHEIDSTADWTTANGAPEAYAPGFYLWYCAENNDFDVDGVFDHLDNCAETENPGQEDTNGDGYGNACDCDLNNDGAVGPPDFMIFRPAWGSVSGDADWNPDADFDANDAVGPSDFSIFRGLWGNVYPWY